METNTLLPWELQNALLLDAIKSLKAKNITVPAELFVAIQQAGNNASKEAGRV